MEQVDALNQFELPLPMQEKTFNGLSLIHNRPIGDAWITISVP